VSCALELHIKGVDSVEPRPKIPGFEPENEMTVGRAGRGRRSRGSNLKNDGRQLGNRVRCRPPPAAASPRRHQAAEPAAAHRRDPASRQLEHRAPDHDTEMPGLRGFTGSLAILWNDRRSFIGRRCAWRELCAAPHAQLGPRAGTAAALGVGTGCFVHITAAASAIRSR